MSYTTATFTRLDRNSDGKASLILTYTGNAGEEPVEFSYPVDASVPPSADYMRGLAMARLSILNNNKNFIASATPFLGTVLDTVTPLPTATPSTYGEYVANAVFTPGATPQDVFTISGSATKFVRITRVAISTVQTTAGMNLWHAIRRSTANTGGTSTVAAAVPADSQHPAASAVVRAYTANPTLGVVVGTPHRLRIPSPVPASAAIQPETEIVNQATGTVAVLRGVSESYALNFNGIALPAGLSVCASVWWSEG